MPTFFADECVAGAIFDGLIQRGFHVVDAKDVRTAKPAANNRDAERAYNVPWSA